MANSRKKISELPALSVASLDTTFVLGISGSTTYKISINNLTSSLDTTFATDLVTNALSSSLNSKLSTSSFNSYTASFTSSVASGTISGSSQLTSSFDTRYTLSGSVTNVNTASLVSRLNAIENVSGSWITESETGSFLTSLSGAISSSSQLTSSFDLRYLVTGSVTSSINALNTATSSYEIKGRGIWSGSAQLPTGIVSGSAQTILNLPTGVVSGSSQLTSSFPSKTTGAWSVPAGASTQSFTVEQGHSYSLWVNGNIPNGIITWNATITTSNSNVPVVGSQYGWYYTPGNALVLTTMPDQIIGTNGSIATTPTSYAPNTSNVFKFGITNNSGTTQTINYGYIKLS